MTAEVIVERPGGGVGVLTLNRPEVRNALGWNTWPQLRDAITELGHDDDIAVVVLTGAGTAFSAGGDVKTIGPRGHGLTAPAARLRLAQEAVRALTVLTKPAIAAVEGFSIGAGWGIVLACDLVVAARDAFFAAPFVQRGLIPDVGTAWLLPRLLGRHRATELFFFGDRVSAEEAYSLGLVNRLVDPGTARDTALALAARLAEGPYEALTLMKTMIRRSATSTLESFLDDEVVLFSLNAHGPDYAEGREAFVEKRPARFGTSRR